MMTYHFNQHFNRLVNTCVVVASLALVQTAASATPVAPVLELDGQPVYTEASFLMPDDAASHSLGNSSQGGPYFGVSPESDIQVWSDVAELIDNTIEASLSEELHLDFYYHSVESRQFAPMGRLSPKLINF
jgi:hypothetical protein